MIRVLYVSFASFVFHSSFKLKYKIMARFDKIAVLNKIGSTGMIPVFYHKDAEVAKKV